MSTTQSNFLIGQSQFGGRKKTPHFLLDPTHPGPSGDLGVPEYLHQPRGHVRVPLGASGLANLLEHDLGAVAHELVPKGLGPGNEKNNMILK